MDTSTAPQQPVQRRRTARVATHSHVYPKGRYVAEVTLRDGGRKAFGKLFDVADDLRPDRVVREFDVAVSDGLFHVSGPDRRRLAFKIPPA